MPTLAGRKTTDLTAEPFHERPFPAPRLDREVLPRG
jgi:hypothetical protein